jgi:Xaa-Pro aminopeptidase
MAHLNPRYGGYFGHPHVCLSVGEPRPEIAGMFQVCAEAYETFKANARPGVSLGEVCRKTLDVIERAGYDWSKEPLCHSIGLAQNEPPNGGVKANPYPDFQLVENQAFGLHPWVGRMAESIGIDSGRPVRITKGGAVPFGGLSSVELYRV